jgi:SAM-dependent methyltransferase
MNELEKLSIENRENYLRYLKRMTDSMKTSTKGFLPALLSSAKSVLDVGCGSGVLMEAIEEANPSIRITGIDINKEAIDKLKALGKNWELYHLDLKDFSKQKYEAIVFSSVLHEISSYSEDPSKKFTSIPIKEAFIKTRELLEENGSIVLRDGILVDKENINKKVLITFKDPSDVIWLYKFRNDFRGFDTLPEVSREITKVGENTFEVGLAFVKEFLCTFTWGKSSFPREVQERFGILDRETWISLLEESGFEVETIIESQEEYEKYLSSKVELKNLDGSKFVYPMMTIIIKARKKKKG